MFKRFMSTHYTFNDSHFLSVQERLGKEKCNVRRIRLKEKEYLMKRWENNRIIQRKGME